MNQNENNFEALRQLLALKRHEVPPPGYFENFSGEVRARLRAGEGSRTATVSEQMGGELPWLLRLLSAFEAKPAFAGFFASALCLLLLGGIVYAERPDITPQPLLQADQNIMSLAVATPSSASSQPAEQPVFGSSTNPVFNTEAAPSLFNPQMGMPQQVSFNLSGN